MRFDVHEISAVLGLSDRASRHAALSTDLSLMWYQPTRSSLGRSRQDQAVSFRDLILMMIKE
jgi:hypothetical protein